MAAVDQVSQVTLGGGGEAEGAWFHTTVMANKAEQEKTKGY